jgi:hypothetical protein
MNSLPSKTALRLIQGIESGAIAPNEAARQIAQIHTAQQENYAQTIISGLVLTGIAWAVTGGSLIIPVVLALLTYEQFQTQRQSRRHAFQDINRGNFLEYLPEADRELFEALEAEITSPVEVTSPAIAPSFVSPTIASKLEPQVQESACRVSKMTDVATHFLNNLRCTFLCAPPRTGKGIVAAAMMMGFKQQQPKSWLGSCTIKQFNQEDWYWQWSDQHINPSLETGADLILAARSIYGLYIDWTSTPSSAATPSLLVIDELRDTLLRLKGVTMNQVTPDFPNGSKDFAEWLRDELVSAATLNQCHHRFVLLIAPVNTATALTFSSANALQSYAAYVLATPEELSFTKGGNSAFTAPPIALNDSRFMGWYGLGWSTKGNEWLGIPNVPELDLERLKQYRLLGSSWVQESEPGSKQGDRPELGSSLGSMSEPYTGRGLELDSDPWVQGSVQPSSELEPAPNRTQITLELNRRGWTQTDIIELLWGVKKGGTKGYQIALEEYRAIVAEWDDS